MRIVAYTDAFAWGGAEESLSNLLAALEPRFDVVVAGTDASIADRVARRRPGTPVVVLPPFGGKFNLRSIRAHVAAFRRLRADVCHVSLRTPYACQGGLIAGLLTRTPIVAVEQLPLHSPSTFMRWTRRRMSPRYAAHVSVGEESARLIETELGLPRGAVGTVYNGLPRLELDPASRNGSGVVLGSIGRLDEQKGYELLVDALADLPGASAVIVGDGPEREALESRASETGVADRLELAGWSDDARSYLPAFDVFVLPSRYEGFPLAIVEAMLAGLPVVAADVGSIPEAVVDGETGLVVPPDDVPALTAALRRMIDDPALRARCGEAGRLRAESRFTSDLMATTFAEIYERAAR